MTLDAASVVMALTPRPLRYFDELGSTNTEALAWLQADAPTGAVVIADAQTAGRGRLGRTWHTPPHSALALSVILRPPASALAHVSMAGGLAVCALLDALRLADVSVKWPNDVLVGGRKVAGVLPEVAWRDDGTLVGVVLGIGVNVRNTFADARLAAQATTLEAATGRALERTALLAVLMVHVDAWCARVGTPALPLAWRARLGTVGQRVCVVPQPGGPTLCGMATQADDDGALWLRLDDGTDHRVIAGDLHMGPAASTPADPQEDDDGRAAGLGN